jgi:hypothetical protein
MRRRSHVPPTILAPIPQDTFEVLKFVGNVLKA